MSKRNANLDGVRIDQAVGALLTEKSLYAAAQKADIPYSSFRRMLGDSKFQEALREARGQVMDAALTRLRGLAEDAVEVVAQTMSGKSADHLQFSAAKWVVEHGIAGLQLDVDERIRNLEEKAKG